MTITFRVPADIASRRSTLRLIALAGIQGFASWVLVQARIAVEAPDGDTSAWTLTDWQSLSQWPGDVRIFLGALEAAELVARRGEGYVPLDWGEEQPHLVHAKERSAAATKAAQTRWNRFLQPALFPEQERGGDASRTQTAMPVPSRSEPNRLDTQGQTAGEARAALPPAGAVPPPFHVPTWGSVGVVAERLGTVLAKLLEHDKPGLDPVTRKRYDATLAALLQFDDPVYWQSIDEWLGGNESRVFYLDEWRAFWAWHLSKAVSQRRRAMQQAFRNWLAKCERWKESDASREEIRGRRKR